MPLGQPTDGGRAVDTGHPEVHQDHVRTQAARELDRLGAVGRLADDLELGVAREHAAQAVADDRVVVDDEEPDRRHDRPTMPGATIAGTRAEIAVPPPGSDSIASVPATRLTR